MIVSPIDGLSHISLASSLLSNSLINKDKFLVLYSTQEQHCLKLGSPEAESERDPDVNNL